MGEENLVEGTVDGRLRRGPAGGWLGRVAAATAVALGALLVAPGTGTASAASWVPPAAPTTVGISSTSTGYLEATSAGNVYNFHTPWYGSAAGRSLPARIVGIAATATGYLLVGAEGNVYNFHTPWYGSASRRILPAPAAGIAVDPFTGGYWVTTAAGNVYHFHAPWYGSPAGRTPVAIDGIVATPTGYLVVSAAGNVYNFHTSFLGSLAGGSLPSPVAAVTADPRVHGSYWLAAESGRVFNFGAPPYGRARTSTPDPRCRSYQLGLAAPASGLTGAAGVLRQTFVLTDRVAGNCHLEGWPGFQAVGKGGRSLPTPTRRVPYLAPPGSLPYREVSLTPGGHAAFDVYGEDYDAVSNKACPDTTAVLVIPPNGSSQQLATNARLPYCGAPYDLTPVVPGSTDQRSARLP